MKENLISQKPYGNGSLFLGPLVLPAAIAGGASLIGGFLSSKGQESANQTNIDIMREQNQWNLDQWNRENEYNTPSAQLARLKEAGLNPNLIYGSGQAVQTAATSPRSAGAHVNNAATGYAQGISGAVGSFMNVLLNQQNLSKIQAQTDLIKEQADLARVLQNLGTVRAVTTEKQGNFYDTSSSLNLARTELITAQIENIDAQTLATRAATTTKETFNKYADDLYRGKVSLQNSARQLNDAQRHALSEKIAQAWYLLDAQAKGIHSQIVTNAARVDQIDQYIKNLQAGEEAQKLKNDILDNIHDYRHINAFFDALWNAVNPLKSVTP